MRLVLLAGLAGFALPLAAAETAATGPVAGEAISSPRSPIDLRNRPVVGVDTAPVVVVEVSSFKCAHCRTFHQEVFPALRARYIVPGKVQWVVLNASDDTSDQFAKIFALARCALRQGKYWEILDSLFSVAHRPPSRLEDLIARSPDIDRAELELCLRDRTLRNDIAGDFARYAELKIRGTPTFLVWKRGADGQRTETIVVGGQKLEYFQRVLDELLKTP